MLRNIRMLCDSHRLIVQKHPGRQLAYIRAERERKVRALLFRIRTSSKGEASMYLARDLFPQLFCPR